MRDQDKERVAAILRDYIVRPPDGVVVMANINDLTEDLIERLYLTEWFEEWDEDDE